MKSIRFTVYGQSEPRAEAEQLADEDDDGEKTGKVSLSVALASAGPGSMASSDDQLSTPRMGAFLGRVRDKDCLRDNQATPTAPVEQTTDVLPLWRSRWDRTRNHLR